MGRIKVKTIDEYEVTYWIGNWSCPNCGELNEVHSDTRTNEGEKCVFCKFRYHLVWDK